MLRAAPKGRGLRFDRLAPADLSLAMSHVNSDPRGALGFATPARAFRAMLGADAEARGGRARRRARPDAGAHRAGARGKGRCPAVLA